MASLEDIIATIRLQVEADPASLRTLKAAVKRWRLQADKARPQCFVQQYFPDGRFVGYFEGPTEATRAAGGAPQAITRAIQTRTLYRGYRWASVPRSDDPTKPVDIGDTAETRQARVGFVAALTPDSRKVLKVYATQAEAGADIGIRSTSAISNAITSDKVCSGYRWSMWDDVPAGDRAAYDGVLPGPVDVGSVYKGIVKMSTSGEVLKTYSNAASVLREHLVARAMLAKAIEEGTILMGFRWRRA